jgi:TRAP-type C4-dicarboxylate transport system permease small subunit
MYIGFGLVYAVALVMALFPPAYLAASGIATPILGIPFAVAYWIIDALLVGLALWALYAMEDIRGELDDESEALTSSPETATIMKDSNR